MPSDAFGFLYKVYFLRRTDQIALMAGNLPSRREMDIQIEKLARMAWAFAEKFSEEKSPKLKTLPAAKLRKIKGQEMHLLVQQSKRVDALLETLCGEAFTRSLLSKRPAFYKKLFSPVRKRGKKDPETGPAVRKAAMTFKKEKSRNVVREVNRLVHQGAVELRLSIAEMFKDLEKVAGLIAIPHEFKPAKRLPGGG